MTTEPIECPSCARRKAYIKHILDMRDAGIMSGVMYGEGQRYQLVFSPPSQQEVIIDTKENLNLFFVATSGFGTRTSMIDLAKEVVDLLNKTEVERQILRAVNKLNAFKANNKLT